jgi:RecB family exonuclease
MFFSHATASRIKTYQQCEFRYFLEYMIQYPPSRQGNIYSEKGSAVHEALEHWANAVLGVEHKSEFDWEKILLQYYKESRLWEMDQRKPEKGGFPHPVEKTCESCPWASKDNRCLIADKATEAVDGCPRPNFQSDVDLINKTFDRTDYPCLATVEDKDSPQGIKFVRNVIGAEVPFDMVIEGVRVRGVIDLVAEDPDDPTCLEIIDYKTGAAMSFAKAYKDPQVRTYGAVARILWPQYKHIMVTLHYLKTTPTSVPLSEEDDRLTILSLQRAQELVRSNNDPRPVRPAKSGFPCQWCIGKEECDTIRDSFRVDGKFRLPTISCSFRSESESCWGSIYPVKDQIVTPDTVKEIIYSCKGHGDIHGGGEYKPDPDDSSKTA